MSNGALAAKKQSLPLLSVSLLSSYCQKIKRSSKTSVEVFRGQHPVQLIVSMLTRVNRAVSSSSSNNNTSEPMLAAFDELVIATSKRAKRDGFKMSYSANDLQTLVSPLLRRHASIAALSYVLEENGHLLSDTAASTLLKQLLAVCSCGGRIPTSESEQVTTTPPREDTRDHFSAAAEAPLVVTDTHHSHSSSLFANRSALRCLNAVFLRCRSNGFLVRQFGRQVVELAINNLHLLTPQNNPVCYSYCLNVLQSIISSGKSALSLYSKHVPGLLQSLHPVLFQREPVAGHTTVAVVSDDSSAWDTDAPSGGAASPFNKLQIHIMLLMSALAKNNFRAFVVDLGPFLPFIVQQQQQQQGVPSPHSLYAIALYHPVDRVRMHAILTIGVILTSGKSLFRSAVDLATHSSTRAFLALSNKLAWILRDVHCVLAIALPSESDHANQQHLMNALVALVHVTPYDKQPHGGEGWLLPVLTGLERLYRDGRDERALRCLASVVSGGSRATIADVRTWLQRSEFLRRLLPDNPASLAIFGSACERYAELAVDSVQPHLDDILTRTLVDESLQHESIVCLRQYLGAAENDWPKVLMLTMMEEPLSPALQKLHDCSEWTSLVASVPANVWQQRLLQSQRACVLDHIIQRAASISPSTTEYVDAVQALGRVLLFTPLPVQFTERACALLFSCLSPGVEQREDNGKLRSISLWALGNLASGDVSPSVLEQCLPCALSAISVESLGASVATCEKLLYGGLRIMSFAFGGLDEATLKRTNAWDVTWRKCIETLAEGNKPKVRWNSANTLTCIIKHHQSKNHHQAVRKGVLDAVRQAANWKVRIASLQCIQERPAYFAVNGEDDDDEEEEEGQIQELYHQLLSVNVQEVARSQVGMSAAMRQQRCQFIASCRQLMVDLSLSPEQRNRVHQRVLAGPLLKDDRYAVETLRDALEELVDPPSVSVETI